MDGRILGWVKGGWPGLPGGLRFLGHYGMIRSISTTIEKLNKDYKPLSVAVFLAIGGLLAGALWSSIFVANPAGMVQERRVSRWFVA